MGRGSGLLGSPPLAVSTLTAPTPSAALSGWVAARTEVRAGAGAPSFSFLLVDRDAVPIECEVRGQEVRPGSEQRLAERAL